MLGSCRFQLYVEFYSTTTSLHNRAHPSPFYVNIHKIGIKSSLKVSKIRSEFKYSKHTKSLFFSLSFCTLRDSRNYMPPILIPASAKCITTQVLVIAKLNGRKYFILRGFICDIIRPSKELPVQSCNLSTRITCESCLILKMSMLTIFNINNISGFVLVSLLLTENIFQTLCSNC